MITSHLKRLGGFACGLLPGAVITVAWLVSRWDDLQKSPVSFLGALSDLPALIGITGFVVLRALGTRFPWIERLFGLDRMLWLHKNLARWVVGLFVAHAVMRTVCFSLHHGDWWTWSFLFYIGTGDWGLLVGHLAFYTVFLAAGLALLGQRGLPFRFWKSGHLLIYPVVILGFIHAVKKGWNDVKIFPTNMVFIVLSVAVLGLLAYRVAYSLRRDRRFTWLVEYLEPETYDTTSLIAARQDDPGPFSRRRAGQFSVIRLKRRWGWGEPHPFTISCSPEAQNLRFTIKAVGPFSSAVPSIHLRPLFCARAPTESSARTSTGKNALL
ncbi:MAG: ferric reductase-like transmembrane domain-containing protein [Desulfuromonadales bacterium]